MKSNENEIIILTAIEIPVPKLCNSFERGFTEKISAAAFPSIITIRYAKSSARGGSSNTAIAVTPAIPAVHFTTERLPFTVEYASETALPITGTNPEIINFAPFVANVSVTDETVDFKVKNPVSKVVIRVKIHIIILCTDFIMESIVSLEYTLFIIAAAHVMHKIGIKKFCEICTISCEAAIVIALYAPIVVIPPEKADTAANTGIKRSINSPPFFIDSEAFSKLVISGSLIIVTADTM
jgi:hypothetical protein